MVYAIGMKGWVELRECAKPPKAKTTKSSRVMVKAHVYFDPYSGRRMNKSCKTKVQLVSTIWEGGDVLTTITPQLFYQITRMTLHPKMVKEVTPAHVKKLMGASWKGEDAIATQNDELDIPF